MVLFAGLRPWYDMGCMGADIVLVCKPVFTGSISRCYWFATKVSLLDAGHCLGFVWLGMLCFLKQAGTLLKLGIVVGILPLNRLGLAFAAVLEQTAAGVCC
ncbi:hypothetical protein Peur_004728 [Populus x canadensis]